MTEFQYSAYVSDPQAAAAYRALGVLKDDDLPRVAESLLERGLDTPALRRLAVESPGHPKLSEFFRKSLEELGVQEFSDGSTAAHWLILDVARKIATGALDPVLGARLIWKIHTEETSGAPLEAHPFIYAASEYESRPEDGSFFANAILQEARDLVDRSLN